ncbi:hypothetical protein ACFV9C_38970 [Kribbella sp. NPDC059898]|uniref:hypothetical protein n=1 Tax=Kribbella sp. NPDC059898 TaxID=3346995 RepID=UPI00365AE245
MSRLTIRTVEAPSLGDRSYLAHDGDVAFVVATYLGWLIPWGTPVTLLGRLPGVDRRLVPARGRSPDRCR